MQALIAPLKELAEYDEIRKVTRQGKGTVALAGCVDSQKLHMIYGLSDGLKYKVIVTYSDLKAKEIYEEYRFYDRNVMLYPAKDLIFFQADIRNDNAAPFHAERLTLRVRRGCQVLGGSHLQRQRGAFRGGNDACAHGLLPVGARHIGGVGHGGRSAQQGGAGLRNDFQPPHDVPREKLQPVRLLHGWNVDFIHAVRQGGLLAHPVAEEILCRLRAGLGGVRQFELIQVAFPQGNDQGIRRRVQLGERIAFRRIERLEPAFQGVPRRFRAHQAYACRA